MKLRYSIFIITLTGFHLILLSQDNVNQLDKSGHRHGYWTKNFEGTQQMRYEGNFENGKEIGVFKYYKLDGKKSVLSATKLFNANNNLAEVKFFTSKGKLVSEGTMNGKLFIGKWTYYHKNNDDVLKTEHYNDLGELHGESITYFENGIMAEKLQYQNGKLNGLCEWYTKNGNLFKSSEFRNDELQGLTKTYDEKGELIIEGAYQSDLRTGIWKYYENGQLTEERLYDENGRWVKQ
ncbi:toxin-antitoxin system YwqK family antitoxin [Paucihalobacter ruber]|uniref:Toxin-antitoxin system YwqK family antitoxin n=1 Tax=Paucihalobacter ruber TaxID=2567861 RepID=A0A506PIK2_9FLAO|nr:toxin-antitoxin system YwqK family antitoxin [Paucihalobacter ruber]TPV32907.1 toxin-antitoxin system YwqK family antitoxin [Paucihalobacter ruber]